MTKLWEPEFSHQDYNILKEEEVYTGYCPIKRYSLEFTLFNGGKMIICPSEKRLDFEFLCNIIAEQQISILESTPGLVFPLMNYIHGKGLEFSSLKLLILPYLYSWTHTVLSIRPRTLFQGFIEKLF